MVKNKRGITLVALVVTIIILLILAGVSINMVFGENGIFSKTQLAAEKYKNAQEKENETFLSYEDMINSILGNRDNLEMGSCTLNINSNGEISVNGQNDIKAYFVIKNDEYLAVVENNSNAYKLETPVNQKVYIYVIGIDNNAKLYLSNIEEYTHVEYSITFNANEGMFADNSTTKTITTEDHSIILPTVTQNGKIFEGWYTDETGGELVGIEGERYTATKNINIYARWLTIGKSPILTSSSDERIISGGIGDDGGDRWGAYGKYGAFDNDNYTSACSASPGSGAIGAWIGLKFEEPVYVTSVEGIIRMNGYKIQYADDLNEENWKDAVINTSNCSQWGDAISDTINNYKTIGAHKYWRLYITANDVDGWGAMIYKLVFNILQ